MIKLEQIDLLRQRTNVTYEEAVEALENSNYDMVEALIYLERKHKISYKSGSSTEEGYGFVRAIKNLIRKGNTTKLVFSRYGSDILRIPVTLAIIITIIAPYLTLLGVAVALFTDHRIKFVKEDGSGMEVNKVFDKVSMAVDDMKESFNGRNQ